MKIQLAHYEFDLTDRYKSGSVLNEAEAKALNVLRSERIRNRVARWLERAAKGGEVLTGDALAELREYVAKTDAGFEFEMRDVTKAKRGTLEAEVRELAQLKAEEMARERGRGADTELVKQLFTALLDDQGIEIEAAARLEARHQVAVEGLKGL